MPGAAKLGYWFNARGRAQEKRYYVILSGPKPLLGVWHAHWRVLEQNLPTGRLFGSGCHVKGFDDPDLAFHYWETKHSLPAPLWMP